MQTAGGVLPLIVGISARLHRVPSWVKFAGDPLIEAQNRRKFVDADRKRRDWKGTARDLIIKAVARLVFRTYNYVWTTTPTVADTLACRWGVTRDRIVVDPNLLDLRDLTNVNKSRISNPELLRLLVVTRLHPVKGVDVAIRALARLPDKRAVLRIIGEGKEPYVGQLRSLANELGVADRIEWAGKVPRERLPDDYRQADLLLVPSRYEAFGIVLIEAMAAGLPIVASNVGGIPHVTCEGKCAKLVEPECPEAFAAAIAALANDPREAERLRREGAKRAFDFDAECGVARWLGLYRQLSSAEAWPRERCAARSGRGFDA
jgi:glycosyltransferase involved in cell wall biosynthesis